MNNLDHRTGALILLITGLIMSIAMCQCRGSQPDVRKGQCLVLNPEIIPGRNSPYIYRVLEVQEDLVYIEQRRRVDIFDLGWYGKRPIERQLIPRLYQLETCP